MDSSETWQVSNDQNAHKRLSQSLLKSPEPITIKNITWSLIFYVASSSAPWRRGQRCFSTRRFRYRNPQGFPRCRPIATHAGAVALIDFATWGRLVMVWSCGRSVGCACSVVSLLDNYQVSTRRLQVSVLFENMMNVENNKNNNTRPLWQFMHRNYQVASVLCPGERLSTMHQPHVPKNGTSTIQRPCKWRGK